MPRDEIVSITCLVVTSLCKIGRTILLKIITRIESSFFKLLSWDLPDHPQSPKPWNPEKFQFRVEFGTVQGRGSQTPLGRLFWDFSGFWALGRSQLLRGLQWHLSGVIRIHLHSNYSFLAARGNNSPQEFARAFCNYPREKLFPPPSPHFGQKAFFREGGGVGCILKPPPPAIGIYMPPPSFITISPRKTFSGVMVSRRMVFLLLEFMPALGMIGWLLATQTGRSCDALRKLQNRHLKRIWESVGTLAPLKKGRESLCFKNTTILLKIITRIESSFFKLLSWDLPDHLQSPIPWNPGKSQFRAEFGTV